MIGNFRNEHYFLSNMFPCNLDYAGYDWNSSEIAYQAAKAVSVEDFLVVASAKDGYESKKLARTITRRKDWDDIKLETMRMIVKAKFIQNEELSDMLVATGSQDIVENNTWGDTYYGVCDGVGENHLGKILMNLRDEITGQGLF